MKRKDRDALKRGLAMVRTLDARIVKAVEEKLKSEYFSSRSRRSRNDPPQTRSPEIS